MMDSIHSTLLAPAATKKTIRRGDVLVNGSAAKTHQPLQLGDRVQIVTRVGCAARAAGRNVYKQQLQKMLPGLHVAWEDGHMAVVVKPQVSEQLQGALRQQQQQQPAGESRLAAAAASRRRQVGSSSGKVGRHSPGITGIPCLLQAHVPSLCCDRHRPYLLLGASCLRGWCLPLCALQGLLSQGPKGAASVAGRIKYCLTPTPLPAALGSPVIVRAWGCSTNSNSNSGGSPLLLSKVAAAVAAVVAAAAGAARHPPCAFITPQS